jgi:VWFA-related protein
MNGLLRSVAFAIPLVGIVVIGAAQSANQQSPQSGYTLHANAREVVTDVTVTDSKGKPIHGLSESAFHIFDNGKPQHLGTFEEHTGQEASAPFQESTGNVFSNDIVLHPPRVFNIIVLDAVFIDLPDQMYLRQQLDRFIQTLPPDEPFAIFARNSEHIVMLADFTADHQKLTKAIDYELPRLITGVDLNYATADISLMEDIGTYLEQYPGRKNVLWFKGELPLPVWGLTPDPATISESVDLRPLYDELEKARVALYPIYTRGLLVNETVHEFVLNEVLMEEEAEATGGQAIFNNNGFAEAARHIADSDSSFYTLSYSPQDVKLDNRWHKVKVEVDGGSYQLSYRRGYFDDGSNLKPAEGPGRKRLLQNGEAVPELHTEPIVFQVGLTPFDPAATNGYQPVLHVSTTPPKKGERPYRLHYSVPMDAFTVQTADGEDHVSLGLAVFAFNKFGRPVARITEAVTLGVSQERVAASGTSPRIGFDQEINLPNGEDFLYIGLWNTQTGRLGTVQIPFAVKK